MTSNIHLSAARILVVVVISLGGFLYANKALAQCASLTIVNNTGLVINNLGLQDGGGVQQFYNVPPGINVGLPAFNPVGILSVVGNFFPFGTFPGPGCFSCTQAIWLQTNLCAYACYDPVCCVLWIFLPDPTSTCVF